MIGIVVGTVAASAGLYGALRLRFPKEPTVYGSASRLTLFAAMQKGLFRKRGIPVGDWPPGQLPVYYEDTNAITFGPSGSGKGVSAIVPTLLNAPFVLLIDVGGENTAIAIKFWRDQGYDVKVINPYGMHGDEPWKLPQDGFNPFDFLDPADPQFPSRAGLLAEMLTKRSGRESGNATFFQNAGESFKQWLIIHIKTALPKSEHHLGTLYRLVNLQADEWEQLLEDMKANPVAAGKVAAGATAMERREAQAPEEFSAIMSTVQQDLEWLSDPMVRENLKRSDVDFGKLKGVDRQGRTVKGCIITVVLPLEYVSTHAAIPRLALSCATMAMQRPPLAREKVIVQVDEAAALGKINSFPDWLATLRKYRVVLCPVFQNIGQVKALYGDQWQTFIANCSLRQFLGTGDLETAEYVHRLLGEFTAESQSVNTEGKVSKSQTRRPLMTVEELLHFNGNKQIAFIGNLKPAILAKTPYWERPELRGKFHPNPYQPGPTPPAFGGTAKRLLGKLTYAAAFLLAPHPAAALIYLGALGYGLFRLWEVLSHVL